MENSIYFDEPLTPWNPWHSGFPEKIGEVKIVNKKMKFILFTTDI